MSKIKTNTVSINGILAEVNTERKVDRNNKPYIGGKIVIKNVVNGVENLIECDILVMNLQKLALLTNFMPLIANSKANLVRE